MLCLVNEVKEQMQNALLDVLYKRDESGQNKVEKLLEEDADFTRQKTRCQEFLRLLDEAAATSTAAAVSSVLGGGSLFDATATPNASLGAEVADIVSGTARAMLAKAYGMAWWPHVVTTEPKLDLSKVEPENSNLGDLDERMLVVVELHRAHKVRWVGP